MDLITMIGIGQFIGDNPLAADLRYLDMTTNGTTIISGSFVAADVGKEINVYEGYHNGVSESKGKTTQGRLVTLNAVILSVVNGVSATISETPNVSGLTRGYVYTNNFMAIKELIDANTNVTLSANGIYGVNPLTADHGQTLSGSGVSCNAFLITKELNLTLGITSAIKLCTENIEGGKVSNGNYAFENENHLFAVANGDFNVTIDGKCLPPNNATLNWSNAWPNVINTSYYEVDAGTSERTIELKNTNDSDNSQTDSSPSYFGGLIYNTGGGVYDSGSPELRTFQTFVVNNVDHKNRHGGMTVFSNNKPCNKMVRTDFDVDQTYHYGNELGRDFTLGDIASNVGRWKFTGTNEFVVSGGVLTKQTREDFSFFSFPVIPASARYTRVSFDDGVTYYQITSITDADTCIVTDPLAHGSLDGTYSNMLIDYCSESDLTGYKPYFLYSQYCHANVSTDDLRVVMDNAIQRFGGTSQAGEDLAVMDFVDCSSDHSFQTENTGGALTFDNCYLRGVFADRSNIDLKDTFFNGGISTKTLQSQGGNDITLIGDDTETMVLDLSLDTIRFANQFTFSAVGAQITISSTVPVANRPLVPNGTLIIV